MTVKLVEVKEILGTPENPINQDQTAKKEAKTRSEIESEYSAITASFRVFAKILAIRFFLFMSLIGSFFLAFLAVQEQSYISCGVLVLYACVTTLPLAFLEVKNRG